MPCLTRCATCSSVRCAGCLVMAPSSLFTWYLSRKKRPTWSAVALRPAGSAQASCALAQQDVVVGPLADEGLVEVEVLAGRPQAQVGVVVLARPGQLPVRAQEQRVGPRPRRRFSTTAPSAPVQARAPPSAASVICCRCLAQLAILFLRAQFFCSAAHSPDLCRWHDFAWFWHDICSVCVVLHGFA